MQLAEWSVRTSFGRVSLRLLPPFERERLGTEVGLRANAARLHLRFELERHSPEAIFVLEQVQSALRGTPADSRGAPSTFGVRVRRVEVLARMLEEEVRDGHLILDIAGEPTVLPEVIEEVELPPTPAPRRTGPSVEKTFIGVHLVDQDNKPVPGRLFRVELPDGSKHEERTDSEGFGRVSGFTLDGTAKVSFPAFDKLDFPKGVTAKEIVIPIKGEQAATAEEEKEEDASPSPEEESDVAAPEVAPTATKLDFFAIRVVDQAGKPIDGVAFNLRTDGKDRPLTSASGAARVDDLPTGSGVVTLSDLAATRELLEQRGIAPGAASSTQRGVASLLVRASAEPITIQSGAERPIMLVLPAREVDVVEVEDGMFRLDSSVLLPEAETPSADSHEALTSQGVLLTALLFAAANPEKKLLIAGHTDTSGTESHNQPLSEERAEITLICLEGSGVSGNRERFAEICDGRHLISDYKQILSWAAQQFGFSCDPGTIDDNEFTGIEPIKAFQQDYNDNRAALGVPDAEELAVDGSMGPKTWAAIFDCYEAALGEELSDAETPEDRLAEVDELRESLLFVDGDRKSQGFGESHPIDQVGRDNVRSQTNRRVELLYFNPGEEPDLDQAPEDSEIFVPGRFRRNPVDPALAGQIVELRFCDPAGSPIPNAPCKLNVGQQPRNQTADGSGIVTSVLPGGRARLVVEWTDPRTPETEAFTSEVFIDLGVGNTADSRRLRNLGYNGDALPDQVDGFRVEFGRAADSDDQTLIGETRVWHDGGNRPTRSQPTVASTQTFPSNVAVA